VAEGDVIPAGRYELDTWNARAQDQGEYPDGFFSDGHDLTGYDWWRTLNTPVRVFRWDPNAKKNALPDRTTCGYFDPGTEERQYRRVTTELFAKPAGG
jgi:hypothetical protein